MAAYGDFTSLAELGTAIGLGLSIFRAPIDKRLLDMKRSIESQLSALRGLSTEFAVGKVNDLSSLRVDVAAKERTLGMALKFSSYAAAAGAIFNAILLSIACLNASDEANLVIKMLYIFAGIVWFAVLLGILEIVARIELGALRKTLEEIQSRTV